MKVSNIHEKKLTHKHPIQNQMQNIKTYNNKQSFNCNKKRYPFNQREKKIIHQMHNQPQSSQKIHPISKLTQSHHKTLYKLGSTDTPRIMCVEHGRI